ncbi:MAG: MFS transporter [Candidatus Brockarchaeota archaeon]|nr:MFS transporter [Candidatus Brockarchaeota archaeon]
MGRLGSSILLSLIDLATFWFYWDFLKLSGFSTGVAFATGKLVIAFFGWYFGYLSDVTKSRRWGRRRQYVLAGSLLLAFSTIMIFMPSYFISVSDETQLFAYATFFLSLANMSYGLLSTPYMAWLAEIVSPEERVIVSAYQNIFGMMAQVVGIPVGFLLPSLLKSGSFSYLGLLVGLAVLEIALYMPAVFTIKEEEKPIPKPDVRRELSILWSNRNYRAWLALQGAMSIPTAVLASLVISYLQRVLGLGDVEYMMAGGLMLLLTILLFFVWARIARRTGKKKPLVTSLMILVVFLPFTLVFGQPALDPVPRVVQAVLFVAFVGAGISGWYLLPNPVTADMAQEDEVTKKEARAGSYVGLVSVPLNILQALARYISGLLADLPPAQGQAYSMGLLLWGPVSSVTLIPCLLILIKYVETDPLRKIAKNND